MPLRIQANQMSFAIYLTLVPIFVSSIRNFIQITALILFKNSTIHFIRFNNLIKVGFDKLCVNFP